MGTAIGIDLGTTNTVAAHFDGERIRVIPNAEGDLTTASVVHYPPDGTLRVGAAAVRSEAVSPDRTLRSIKRHMGTGWTLPLDGHTYTPVDVSAAILAKVRADASAWLGADVTEAVITVPAYFGDAARRATKQAGELAGLDVLHVLNEPTAAILAATPRPDGVVAVFDLGGGTYDVSVVHVAGDDVTVLSTAGDARTGGDDLDRVLVALLTRGTGVNLNDPVAAVLCADAARRAKHDLTAASTAHIRLPYLPGGATIDTAITRDQFNAAAAAVYRRLDDPYRAAAAAAGRRIERLLLVGGSTRVPAVATWAANLSGLTPQRTLDPDLSVASGAAVAAWKLSAAVTGGGGALTLYTGTAADVAAASGSDTGTVGLPAPVSAAARTRLIDVTGHPLGTRLDDGRSSIHIPAGARLPASATRGYQTVADGQTVVRVGVYEGGEPYADSNALLGEFRLEGLRPAPAGAVQLEVTFTVDTSGILTVTAVDVETGRSESLTLASDTLYDDDQFADAEDDLAARRQRADADELIARAEQLALTGGLDRRARRKLDRHTSRLRKARTKDGYLTGPLDDLRGTLVDVGDGPAALTSGK